MKYEGKEREKFLEIMHMVAIKRWCRARCRKTGNIVRSGSIAALFAVASGSTGCVLTNPNGFESYASIGLRAVSEHQESTATIKQPCAGLRGWWSGCATETPAKGGERYGS
jgi:hypothetical protein